MKRYLKRFLAWQAAHTPEPLLYFNKEDEFEIDKWEDNTAVSLVYQLIRHVRMGQEDLTYLMNPFCLKCFWNCKECLYGMRHGICSEPDADWQIVGDAKISNTKYREWWQDNFPVCASWIWKKPRSIYRRFMNHKEIKRNRRKYRRRGPKTVPLPPGTAEKIKRKKIWRYRP